MAKVGLLPRNSALPGFDEKKAALALAQRMPNLVLEARRVAATLVHGLHGRRRAGHGENFWQFRPFIAGESASRIDWRRSARDDRLYVREREWEAAHTIWIWIDRSASMRYGSDLAPVSKIDRALVLGLAFADVFVEAGEKVGLLGLLPASAHRGIVDKFAQALSLDSPAVDADLPPPSPISAQSEVVLIGDFLSPPTDIRAMAEAVAARGARGHLLVVVDPVEETFPFSGQTILSEPETGLSLRIGDAGAWAQLYHARIERHRGELEDIARALGWTMTIHHTDRPVSEPALRLLSLVEAERRRAKDEA